MRRFVSLFACAVLACLLLPSAARSQVPQPALGFWPGFSFPAVGHMVDVQVRATSFVGLYGCQIEVQYDPAVLEVQDADPNTEGIQIKAGDVFVGSGTFVAMNAVDPQAGVIHFAAALLDPAPPINGSATLMRVRFKTLRPGPTMIRFGEVILVNSRAEVIDARLADGGMWIGPIR